jgi:hypothetical protein
MTNPNESKNMENLLDHEMASSWHKVEKAWEAPVNDLSIAAVMHARSY